MYAIRSYYELRLAAAYFSGEFSESGGFGDACDNCALMANPRNNFV